MSGRAWRFPLQELPKPAAWLLLLVLPAIAGIASVPGGVIVFDFVLPYVLLVGGLSGTLELRSSRTIQIGGLGDMGLAMFRNVCQAGALVAVSLVIGVAAGRIIANFGVDV